MNQRTDSILGVTLLELLVALAIVAILAATATPALVNILESSRSKAVRQQLQSFFGEARSHALEQSEIVTICHLGTNSRCADELEFPLTMFADPNRRAELNEDDQIIKIFDFKLPEDATLAWNRNGYVRFWPSGGTGALTGSMSYCHSYDDKYEFRVVIARTGRVRIDFDETRCD